MRGQNVIDVKYDLEDILKGVMHCLYDDNFRHLSRNASNPYWLGDVGPKIADILSEAPLGKKMIRKRMSLKGETRDGWYK